MKNLGWIISTLLCWLAASFATNHNGLSCADVKRAFTRQNIGSALLVPRYATMQHLSICPNHGPSCCNAFTEKKFTRLAKEPMSTIVNEKFNSLRSRFFDFLRKFESEMKNTVDRVKRKVTDMVMKKLKKPSITQNISATISTFFKEINISRDQISPQNITNELSGSVQRFYDSLLGYKFIEKVNYSLDDDELKCFLSQAVLVPRYQHIPQQLAKHLIRTFNQTSTFVQAIHAAIEALNVSSKDFIDPECENALVRMRYCSHCQIFTEAKPCRGYCRNVVSGCLVGVDEISRYWQHYVTSLMKLTNQMLQRHDDVDSLLNDLVQKVKDLVDGRTERNVVESLKETCSSPSDGNRRPKRSSDTKKAKKKRFQKVEQIDSRTHLEQITLKPLMREFIHFLREKTNFFLNLPEAICSSQHYFSVEGSCWDGNTVIERYSKHLSRKGLKEQLNNPEMQVDGVSSPIQQSVEKLRISSKVLKVRTDDPVPIFLLQPPYYVTDKSNQSESSTQNFSDPCWDDEDGCQGVASGNGDVIDLKSGSDVVLEANDDSDYTKKVNIDLSDSKITDPIQQIELSQGMSSPPTAPVKDSNLSKSKAQKYGPKLKIETQTPPNSAQGCHSNAWAISFSLFAICIWKLMS